MRLPHPRLLALPVSLVALLIGGCGQTPTTVEHVDASRPGPACGFATLTVSAGIDPAHAKSPQPTSPRGAMPAPNDSPGRAAATALLDSMTDDQRANTLLPLDHEARDDWHFVPRRRRGLALGAMTDAQRHDLHRLLQHGLSDSGYLKAMDIVWLESVLEQLENRAEDDHYRDPGRYTLLLFGDPADADSAWGWRFEGHHLSLNFTYAGGADGGVITTPMFMGTAPAVVPSGLHAGKRILADEHNLAFAFIATLTDEQRDAMMIGDVPGDVVTGPGREQSLREPVGIARSDMSEDQEAALLALLMVYFDRLDSAERERFIWPEIVSEEQYFAWAGSTNPEEPHYYRIYQGNNFVIEYCTRDGGVDHIHGVFHDLTDPLAKDLLREHFEQHHAEE